MNSTEITSDSYNCKGSGGESIQITETNSTTQESAMIEEIMWPFMIDHGMHTSGTNGEGDNTTGGGIGTHDQLIGNSCEGGEKCSCQEEIDSDREPLLTTENNDLPSNLDFGSDIEVPSTTQLKLNTNFAADIIIKNHKTRSVIYKVLPDSSITVDPSMGLIRENSSSVIRVTADFKQVFSLESTVWGCPDVVTVLLADEITEDLKGDDQYKTYWEELETKQADKIKRYLININNAERLREGFKLVEDGKELLVNIGKNVKFSQFSVNGITAANRETESTWKCIGICILVIAIVAAYLLYYALVNQKLSCRISY